MESNETAGTVNRKTAEDSLELALEAQVIPQSPGGTARRVGQKSPMAAMQKREKKVVNRLGIGRLENGEPFIHGWPVERRPPSLEGVPSQSVVEAANWIGKAMKVVQNHMDSYLVRKPVLNCKDLRLRVSSGFTGLDASGRACKIIEKNGSKCQFQMESVCDNDVDVQEGLLHDKHFENQCVFQNALDLVDHATRKKLYQAKGIDEINAVLDTATWQTHARCLRHPLQPGGCKLPAKIDLDLAGASCKDDSLQGSFKQDAGNDRKSALCHWRYHLQAKTKIFVAENVVTGSIHELTSKVLSRGGACSIKCIHTSPSDSGHGGVRRFRGWTLALRKDAGQWIAEPQKVYDLMSEALQSKQVGIQDMYFLDDPMLLRDERERMATKNRPYKESFEQMLTRTDKDNLKNCWERLDKDIRLRDLQHLHVGVPQQGGDFAKMTSGHRTISTFTTVDWQWSRAKERWLSGLEKLCLMGFPCVEGIAEAYNCDLMNLNHWKNLHVRSGNSQHLPNSALVLLATLASIEFYPESKIPPQLGSKTTIIPVPADGMCFWSCLWLATEATVAEVYAWFKRPRNRVGMASSKDGAVEMQRVKDWANSLAPKMHRWCQQRLKNGLSAEHEDIVWASVHLKIPLFIFTGEIKEGNSASLSFNEDMLAKGIEPVCLWNHWSYDGNGHGSQHFSYIAQAEWYDALHGDECLPKRRKKEPLVQQTAQEPASKQLDETKKAFEPGAEMPKATVEAVEPASKKLDETKKAFEPGAEMPKATVEAVEPDAEMPKESVEAIEPMVQQSSGATEAPAQEPASEMPGETTEAAEPVVQQQDGVVGPTEAVAQEPPVQQQTVIAEATQAPAQEPASEMQKTAVEAAEPAEETPETVKESVGSVGEDEFYDPADVESLPGDEDGLEGQQDVMMEKVMQDPAPVKKSSKEAEQVQFEDGDVDPNMDPVNESSGPLEEIDFVSFHGVDPMIHGSEKGSHYAPPAFFDREAFKSLAEKGLTVIPAEQGYMLSYHSKTFQWHARCVWKDANMAPTWGATRTEEQALCLAIERSWMWFVELNPNDEEGVLRLGKIREHLKKNQLMKRGAACFSTCCAGTCTVSSFHTLLCCEML